MIDLTINIDLLARELPPAFVTDIQAREEEAFGPEDTIHDVLVNVEATPGWSSPGVWSGPSDNWSPPEGENPDIVRVLLAEDDSMEDITKLLDATTIEALEERVWEFQEDEGLTDRGRLR